MSREEKIKALADILTKAKAATDDLQKKGVPEEYYPLVFATAILDIFAILNA